jgi:benzoate/toluate 1,2-dioxygenase alpha subunit
MDVNAANPVDTSYADLVVENGLDFKVDTRVYTDAAIFEDEMHRIFESTWVYVGHISEVPQPGDYKTATIGRNPVIVSRAEDGEIYVLLNECRHRGVAVCREPFGNSDNFTCPYHGWVYANSGDLISVSHPKGYPPGFAAEMGGLLKLRSATYRGLVFASMNDHVPDIEDHLGDVRKYVDLWADLSPEPEAMVARPHRYGYPGNWKFQAENGIDGWHARFVHASAFGTLAEFGGEPLRRFGAGITRGFDNGFAILERKGITQGLSDAQREDIRRLMLRRHAPERVDLICYVRHIFLFPNLQLFDNLIRIIQPVSVDRTNVISYPFHLRGVPETYNRVRLPELQSRLGTSGLVGADDLEMFAAAQTGMRGAKMRWIQLSHGMAQDEGLEGSEILGDDTSEVPQRSIYRHWAKMMNGDK